MNNLAVLLLANFFTAGVGFLTTVTIANTLGSARFGELAYAVAIGGILATNVRFGMDRSLIRDLTHFPELFNETLAASLLARGLLLILCIAGLLILMALPIEDLKISWGMFLVILATALNPFQIANVFDTWEIQGIHALYDCTQKAVYFGMIWAVVFWVPEYLGLLWIGAALLISGLFFIFLQYRFAWRRLKPTLHAMPITQVASRSFSLLGSNKWLWLAGVATLGMITLNKVILKHVSGFSELGVFAASLQLVSLATLLLTNIARIGRPILARYTKPATANTHATALFLAFYLSLGVLSVSIVALPAIMIPRLILEIFFIPEYASGYWVLRVLGISLLFSVFDLYLGQYLTMVRMDRSYLIAAVLSGLISFVFCLILVPLYSATGAALAILVAELFKSGLFVFLTIFHLKNLDAVSAKLGIKPGL